MLKRCTLLWLAASLAALVIACNPHVGRYETANLIDGNRFIVLVDGKTFESNDVKGTYRIEGKQITFEVPLNQLQRGTIETDTITFDHGEFLTGGTYKKVK